MKSIPYEHAGLQIIRKWRDDAETACSFQTLLVVQVVDDEESANSGIFKLEKCLSSVS
jgi:hypothetical protein